MLNTSQAEIHFALDVVRRACALAQQVQAEMTVQGVDKADMSPVTVADYAIQALVGHALAEAFPGVALVGEESAAALRTEEGAEMRATILRFVERFVDGATEDDLCDWIDYGTAEPGDRFWTLDPVDGTKGYLRGEQYAVALALIEQGQVVLGVLGCPNLGEDCCPDSSGDGCLLVAQRGEGAWLSSLAVGGDNPLEHSTDAGQFRKLAVSAQGDPAQARLLRSVESGHTNIGEIDEIATHLGVQAAPVCLDSQAKYAVLAAGGGEMLFRLLSPKKPDYKERIWDQAAGSIILEEAGGRITDLRGKPLDFGQGRGLEKNTGVFATNGHLHEAGLEAIRAVCRLPE